MTERRSFSAIHPTDAGAPAGNHRHVKARDHLVLRCEWCGEEVALEEAGSMLLDPQTFVERHRKCLTEAAREVPEPTAETRRGR